jgi:EAL domain-containing protein (putative c-di-GMP-specific phosphodiesterase class I)/CheY-like chemotaxis protein
MLMRNVMPDIPPTSNFQVSSLRVLVLEDQPFQRRLLVGLLQSCGIKTILEAGEGNEGLLVLDQNPQGFDIAIVDLKMDGMDGIEFIRHAARRNVQGFIVTSALEPYLFSYVTELGNEFGAPILGILPKPVTIEHIKSQIGAYLNREALARKGNATVAAPSKFWSKSDLVSALKHEQFVPYFQPKVDLLTRRPVGVEILARWSHPVLGVLPPLQFIERMEEKFLIDQLTESIFKKALACSAQWGMERERIGIALNASPLTLQKKDFARQLLTLVKQFDTAPEQITIEVTETAVSEDTAGLLETLTRLRMQGFNISVDDFGTGYSSLLQLSELPFNEIKIDRMFVHGSSRSGKATIILESIIQLALKLGTHIVAEGIETDEELRFIQSLGCPTGQGFHLAAPMSHQDFLSYLTFNSVRK